MDCNSSGIILPVRNLFVGLASVCPMIQSSSMQALQYYYMNNKNLKLKRIKYILRYIWIVQKGLVWAKIYNKERYSIILLNIIRKRNTTANKWAILFLYISSPIWISSFSFGKLYSYFSSPVCNTNVINDITSIQS